MQDYRTMFEKHYNLKLSSYYDIHHIDLNHNNNSIDNLMIMPKKLHLKYHSFVNKLKIRDLNEIILISGNRADESLCTLNLVDDFVPIVCECNKWRDYKSYLDGEVGNLHCIILKKEN